MGLTVIILAAGEGKRMRSAHPKVLHPLGGRPMLDHPVSTASELGADRIIVVHGYGGAAVQAAMADRGELTWVAQEKRCGTGHAVRVALDRVASEDRVLVLYGDVPLVRPETMRELLAALEAQDLAVLSTELPDPTGYGRIVRDDRGDLRAIVEERDAEGGQRRIREVNTGIMAARPGVFQALVPRLGQDNAQGEYYLTDTVALARADGRPVAAVVTPDPEEVQGVNNRSQLARVERLLQWRRAEALMAAGVTLADPARLDVRGEVHAAEDVTIDVGVILAGTVRLAPGVQIGAHSLIRDTILEPGVCIEAHSIVEGAHLGARSQVGPFARVRPGSKFAEAVHIGNFVETKKADIGAGSKANHLSYLGDATIGAGVNIGAGSITCNYDGANKHRTVIGDNVFIGSDSQLVAPVTVGSGATIGAGSVITRDAPADQLTLARTRQVTRATWRRPEKRQAGAESSASEDSPDGA